MRRALIHTKTDVVADNVSVAEAVAAEIVPVSIPAVVHGSSVVVTDAILTTKAFLKKGRSTTAFDRITFR